MKAKLAKTALLQQHHDLLLSIGLLLVLLFFRLFAPRVSAV